MKITSKEEQVGGTNKGAPVRGSYERDTSKGRPIKEGQVGGNL